MNSFFLISILLIAAKTGYFIFYTMQEAHIKYKDINNDYLIPCYIEELFLNFMIFYNIIIKTNSDVKLNSSSLMKSSTSSRNSKPFSVIA